MPLQIQDPTENKKEKDEVSDSQIEESELEAQEESVAKNPVNLELDDEPTEELEKEEGETLNDFVVKKLDE